MLFLSIVLVDKLMENMNKIPWDGTNFYLLTLEACIFLK